MVYSDIGSSAVAAAAVMTTAQLQEREAMKSIAKAGNELLVWLTEVRTVCMCMYVMRLSCIE